MGLTHKMTELYSEPYGASGNIGENFRRLLGAPALNALHTVIRESLQNVSDAAKLNQGPRIEINLRTLSEEQKAVFSNQLMTRLPVEKGSKETIQKFLNKKDPLVMEVCDFNTTGLLGPTRADRIPLEETDTDFIDFLRNIGTPRDTHMGGGTYGFGKVSLYRMSKCSSIWVDTKIPSGERRLIGCHIGKSFKLEEEGFRRSYTGRHWWGAADDEGFVDPILNEQARHYADLLGLPLRDDLTGTSIMILDAEFDGAEIHEAGKQIVEAVMWNFWPRLMRSATEDKRFTITINVNGEALEIPAPEDVAPFKYFCAAMDAARTNQTNETSGLKLKTLHTTTTDQLELGRLAIMTGPYHSSSHQHNFFPLDSIIPNKCSHIALMRPAELVVKYLVGPQSSNNEHHCGVFLVNEEESIERAFADAEPPAHDDWVPDNLPNRSISKRVVKQALNQLKAEAKQLGLSSARVSTGDVDTDPRLQGVVTQLGRILDNPQVTTGGGGGGGGGGVGPATRSRLSIDTEGLSIIDGQKVATFTLNVPSSVVNEKKISISPKVMMDGGAIDKSSSKELGCKVIHINGEHLDLGTDKGDLILAKQEELKILVSIPYGMSVRLDAKLGESVDG